MIYVFEKASGRVIQVVIGSDESSSNYADDSVGVLISSEYHDPDSVYVDDEMFVEIPQSPPHHEWDWTTKSWLPNLDAARASKLQQVSAELNTRLYLPCNGFDADKVSRERISGTIARLQRGDGLPAGWLGWRDASNNMHWATDDAATVLANLTALSRAIEDREQALLMAAWQHKAIVAALTDIGAILTYDATQAWPT